jgi:hypothetical protein
MRGPRSHPLSPYEWAAAARSPGRGNRPTGGHGAALLPGGLLTDAEYETVKAKLIGP